MPFNVQYRGLTVVVDTLDDLDALADQLQSKKLQSSFAATPVRSVGSIVRSATDDQKKLLQFLVDQSPASDDQIRTHLGVEDNKSLAGITAGLSKRLQSAGIQQSIVKNDLHFEQGVRRYKYWIDPAALEEVIEALKAPIS